MRKTDTNTAWSEHGAKKVSVHSLWTMRFLHGLSSFLSSHKIYDCEHMSVSVDSVVVVHFGFEMGREINRLIKIADDTHAKWNSYS